MWDGEYDDINNIFNASTGAEEFSPFHKVDTLNKDNSLKLFSAETLFRTLHAQSCDGNCNVVQCSFFRSLIQHIKEGNCDIDNSKSCKFGEYCKNVRLLLEHYRIQCPDRVHLQYISKMISPLYIYIYVCVCVCVFFWSYSYRNGQ